jgi:hypothetical protein
MGFSATEAAFEGFRVVRRTPTALIWWALLYAVLTLGSFAAMGANVDSFTEMVRISEEIEAASQGGAEPSMEQVGEMMAVWGRAMAAFAWILPLQLVVTSMLMAAVARAVIRPSERRFGFLRLSMDEVRVFVVTLVLSILMSLIAVASLIPALIAVGAGAAMESGWAVIPAMLLFFGAFALIVWLAVRWSLAVPITVAERRMAFFDSFRLTKGRFWGLLGLAIIAIVMVIVISLLASVVIAPLTLMGGASAFGRVDPEDPASVFQMFSLSNPWMVVQALVQAVVNALTVAVAYAPFAAAYVGLKGVPAAD